MTQVIDLRSDTVSKPSDAMRTAMANAPVGDDVFGDDPTVRLLEQRAAEIVGKEAALFVPSGTMANLVALLTHTRPGDEVILGDESHIFQYELGGVARLGGLITRPLTNLEDGSMQLSALNSAIRIENLHSPGSRLLCLENTHNRCGGSALPTDITGGLTAAAKAQGLMTHLDGARLFNAATALNKPASELARDFDSVSFCLSKGLGCPIGSLLCGSGEFVERARRNRKMLGGGMRQVGIIAGAGLYALENNLQRISEDHINARALADGLRELGPFRPNIPQTNIVVADVVQGSLSRWLAAFEEAGVLAVAFGPKRMRMVTHINIKSDDIGEALSRIQNVVETVPV